MCRLEGNVQTVSQTSQTVWQSRDAHWSGNRSSVLHRSISSHLVVLCPTHRTNKWVLKPARHTLNHHPPKPITLGMHAQHQILHSLAPMVAASPTLGNVQLASSTVLQWIDVWEASKNASLFRPPHPLSQLHFPPSVRWVLPTDAFFRGNVSRMKLTVAQMS